ncbi:MAG TPA: class I SAM-dependent methyltransferase [Candidatus Paceibacterota bacterium]
MNLSLESTERLNRKSQDLVAKRRHEFESTLGDPVSDLELFGKHTLGKKVLDVGCGWGRYVHGFLGLGFEYYGIDLSFEMVKAAQEKNPDISFTQMSFRNLTFKDASFDALWCCCSLSYEPKRNLKNVLCELRRFLQPDGLLLVVLHDYHASEEETSTSGEEIGRGHFSLWHPEEFAEELHVSGFKVGQTIRRCEEASMTFLATNDGCDCQNPPPDTWDGKEGTYHVSNECPVHNWNPYQKETSPHPPSGG